MNIEQPMPNTILPEDVQNQTTAARVALADLETKISILVNQTSSLKKDNATLTKEREYLNSENVKKELELEKVKGEILSEQQRATNLKESSDKIVKELIEKETIQEAKYRKYRDQFEFLIQQQKSFENILEMFEAKKAQFLSEKEIFENWASRVKAITSEVT